MAVGVMDEFLAQWTQNHGGERTQLLPLLHDVQAQFGFIDDAFVPLIAKSLNLTRADVHGVVTFYHDFRRKPAGRHVLKLCRAEACQARGGAAVEAAAETALRVTMGETRADGQVTLEPIYCLGLCAVGPAAMVNGRMVARLDATGVARIADEVAA
jgi:formate dehydrogenase subunit gamma